MSNAKTILVTYNKTPLHVLYVKDNDKVSILTINKAHKVIYHELLAEIEVLVNKEIKLQEAKEYADEQRCEEEGGWASEVVPHESDWEL